MKYISKTFYVNKFKKFTLQKHPGIYRPSSLPFISGDTLRAYSDHVFDESKTLKPERVNKNDIVFVKTDLIDQFFGFYHKKIKNKYILLTHNSDKAITINEIKYLDEKIIHWFAMKLDYPMDDKISPLPSGLENRRFLANGRVKNFNSILKNHSFKNKPKENSILCSFNVHTNFDTRNSLLEQVRTDEKVQIKKFNKNIEYLNALTDYKYILCPEGNNFESHRIWESLIFGCTPILIKNNVNINFNKIGVPMILLENWEMLSDYSFDDLNELNFLNSEKNYLEFSLWKYWKERIDSKKIY